MAKSRSTKGPGKQKPGGTRKAFYSENERPAFDRHGATKKRLANLKHKSKTNQE